MCARECMRVCEGRKYIYARALAGRTCSYIHYIYIYAHACVFALKHMLKIWSFVCVCLYFGVCKCVYMGESVFVLTYVFKMCLYVCVSLFSRMCRCAQIWLNKCLF